MKSPHGSGSDNISDATRITIEEAAALQTFPADHIFRGNKGEIGLQIGNAVPVLLARRILEALWKEPVND